ncbi:MAG: UDP-N-acetylmuramate dehydrogenase [Oscillospiraceae bacterium]
MDNTQAADSCFKEANIDFVQNEPLKNHSTFKIGGLAAFFVSPKNIQEVITTIQIAKQCTLPYFILGEGSNVVFNSEGFRGVVVYLGSLNGIKAEGSKITAQAGAKLWDVCLAAKDSSLTGLCFGYGIPGSVGGAMYMNAGAFDGEMKCVAESVEYLMEDGTLKTLKLEEMQLGYRTSVFQAMKGCILSARFSLAPGNKDEIAAKMEDFWVRRQDKQPLDMPSAGSAFKRPEGAFAGALIDNCGLRGYRMGDAAISDKHCGFIVNHGNATSNDIVELANYVSLVVKEKTGYTLEREIRIIDSEGNPD